MKAISFINKHRLISLIVVFQIIFLLHFFIVQLTERKMYSKV